MHYITEDQKAWLKEILPAYYMRTIHLHGEVYQAYVVAEHYLFGLDKERDYTCQCEMKNLGQRVNNQYEKFLETYGEKK